MLPLRQTLAFLLCFLPVQAGVVITRSEQGFQFADATSVLINGKDKVQSLGDQPKAAGPLSKLPNTKLSGMLLRDSDSGVVAQYDAGDVEYLVPQGLPKGSPEDPAAVWNATRIAYKQSAADKAGTEVAAGTFVAFLPRGVEDLAAICIDAKLLAILGGKAKVSTTQSDLMKAAVKTYPANPALAPLEKYLEDALRSRYQAFESGAGGAELLLQGLQIAELSAAVYPDKPEQQKLRKQLQDRKAWLDRRTAILRALSAGSQWDTYLISSRDLERYEPAFPAMAQERTRVLQESLLTHSKTAATRKQEGDYSAAYREFKLAAARKPSDAALRDEAMQAWTEYSRRIAVERQSKRTRLTPGPQSTVERALFFAEQNRQAKKLDDALKNVQDAENVLNNSLAAGSFSSESLKVLAKKAELLTAQERVTEALAALDAYDLMAVDEERSSADKLRNQLLFSLSESLKNVKARMQNAWAAGNFQQAGQLAAQGLRMKADDPDLLYYGGFSAVIRRQPKEGRDLLVRYLAASANLDGNPEEHAKVLALLPSLESTATAGDGAPNWLSGWKLPSGVFYCPISLAFQPQIERIEGSNKLRVAFEWDAERLKSVTPSVEGAGGERKISFVYDDKSQQVVWAADEESSRRPAGKDADDPLQSTNVVLLNSPVVDPLAVQRVTGKNIAVGVAFNRYFNPFVWEKLYFFRLTYDAQGRVISARELSGPKGSAGEQNVEFEWNGMQLAAIRGFQGKAKLYERTMQYQGGRLVSEEIQGQGKPSRIRYIYAGNRLVSAETTNDATLDNRSRKVTFRSTSPSTLVK